MGFGLRDLELFVAVLDAGSITSGAHAVGLSLSSASARIAGMEHRHGLRLLRRRVGGVTPTTAGEALGSHARGVLREAGALERAMERFRDGPEALVRVVSNTSAVDALTEFLAASLARIPDMRVAVSETTSAEAAGRVRDGAGDLGVVSSVPDPTGLAVTDLWPDPLFLVARAPRGDRGVMSFEEAIRRPKADDRAR